MKPFDSNKAVLFHNPRCSKSRQAKAILEEHGVEFEEYPYLQEPPDVGLLRTLQHVLGFDDPRRMMRTKEAEYRELGLDGREGDELIQAMAEHPKLIERPILMVGDRAVIGRPPERVTELL